MTPELPSIRQVLLGYERARALNGQLYAHVINHYWQRLRELTGEEAIAVHVAAQFNPLEHPQYELYLTSRTLDEAMTRAFQFFNSLNPHSQWASYKQPGGVKLTLSYARDLGLLHFDAEWRLSLISHAIQWFSQEFAGEGDPTVSFRAHRPAYDQELVRALGCPAQFDQPVDAVIVDAKVMETPIWGSESVRLKFTQLVSAAIEETKRANARLSEHVMRAIRSGLERADCGIKSVAPRLGMSPRTLQRKLAEEGTHYARILDQTRMDLCMQIMAAPDMNIANIAERLCYSNGSNFDHAFQRWFGTTPGLFRLMAGGRNSKPRSSHVQRRTKAEVFVADRAVRRLLQRLLRREAETGSIA